MNEKYVLIQDFVDGFIRDRFTNKGYNLLPMEDLEQIHFLSSSYSNELWEYWIGPVKQRLVSMDYSKLLKDKNAIRHIEAKWDEMVYPPIGKENETKEFLEKLINLSLMSKIYFFWDYGTAIETVWGIFLKYWTDFCYPSDDSNVIIFSDHPIAVEFMDGYFSIVNRVKEFGRN